MPVNEGQEPEVPNGGQPIVEGGDEDLSSIYAPYDPTLARKDVDDQGEQQKDDALYGPDGKALPTFDERYADDFEGLVFLGALTKSFEWLGHQFVVKTLTGDEILAVGQIVKPWQDTLSQARAYTIAMASLAIVSVDGQELPIPIDSRGGDYAWAYQRFNYVKANWFQTTVDKVYSEYMALDAQALAVLEAMEKASGPAASTGGSNAASAGPSDRDF